MNERAFVEPYLAARLVPGKEQVGAGLFATARFAPGQAVLQLDWTDEDRAEIVAWDDTDEEHQERCTAVAPRWYFYVTNEHPFWFLNHSCRPNIGFADWARPIGGAGVPLVALREINPGDEVTIDYSTMTTADDAQEEGGHWTMECLCGENNCRRTLTDFVSLPREAQVELITRRAPVSGVVPAFIVNEAPELVAALRSEPELSAAFQSALAAQLRLAEQFAADYEDEENENEEEGEE